MQNPEEVTPAAELRLRRQGMLHLMYLLLQTVSVGTPVPKVLTNMLDYVQPMLRPIAADDQAARIGPAPVPPRWVDGEAGREAAAGLRSRDD